MLKNHTPLCQLLSFCITECPVSITMNGMHGWPIIYNLAPLDVLSLISPKITLALCLLLAFCKNRILFLP